MQILNLQYSPYQNGKISGEYFKKNVKIDIENIKIKIDKNIEIKEKIEEQFNNLKLTFPKYYDEVIGKAVHARATGDYGATFGGKNYSEVVGIVGVNKHIHKGTVERADHSQGLAEIKEGGKTYVVEEYQATFGAKK